MIEFHYFYDDYFCSYFIRVFILFCFVFPPSFAENHFGVCQSILVCL